MYRGSRLRSIWNTNVITGCGHVKKYVPKKLIGIAFEHERYHRFGHVLKYVPKQWIAYSTLKKHER